MNRLAPIVLVALGAAACSGDDGIDSQDLPDALRSAECDFEVRCEQVPDAATCADALPFNSTDELTTLADIDAGIIKYDAKLAKRCVDLFAGLGCSLTAITNDTLQPCTDMFAGTVAPGGTCFINEECADHGQCEHTDTNCNENVACCVGACVAVPAKSPIGGACGDTGSGCVTGAYCSIPDGQSTGACTAKVTTEGGACDAFDGCATPLQCDLDFTTGTGTCKTLPDEGETCDTQSLFSCSDVRDFCDVTTAKCLHRVDVGETCGGTTGASCIGFAGCDATTLKCVERPGLGDACDDSATSTNCLGELDCVNAKCVAPPAGMTCSQ